MKFKYRVAPVGCIKSGKWYQAEGMSIRHALSGECRAVTIDGDPVRVEVEGEGYWWLSAESVVTYHVRPDISEATP